MPMAGNLLEKGFIHCVDNTIGIELWSLLDFSPTNLISRVEIDLNAEANLGKQLLIGVAFTCVLQEVLIHMTAIPISRSPVALRFHSIGRGAYRLGAGGNVSFLAFLNWRYCHLLPNDFWRFRRCVSAQKTAGVDWLIV
jgi:hypothetical protein